jgi:hypothetical protein
VRYENYSQVRPRRRSWLVALPLALFILVALGWSAFWYYASAAAQTTIDGWREREARSGRIYTCGSQSLSGYPFRFEVECNAPSIGLNGDEPHVEIKAKDIVVVAQVYDPTLLISEFTGPLTVGDPGREPTWTVNWTLAQTSVRGRPSAPERVSFAIDNPVLRRSRTANAAMSDVAQAAHLEFHGRIVEGSANDHPLVELVLRLGALSAAALHPIAAEPINGEIRATIEGLHDLRPKPWRAQLRDLQSAGGRLDIKQARLQQAGATVVGAGVLTLTARGALDGQLQLTIVGLDHLLAGFDIDRAASHLLSQADLDKVAPGLDANKLSQGLDRILPGLGVAMRKNSGAIAAAGVSAIGQQTVLDGKPAVAVPLRFSDGMVSLGPLRLGEIAPLF